MFVFCFFFLFFFFVVDFVVCVVFTVVVARVFDVIVVCWITFLNDTGPPSMGILASQIPGQKGSAGAPKGLQFTLEKLDPQLQNFFERFEAL